MPDEMMQGEEMESQALNQILQICQSAQDPSGYQQIAEIVQGLVAHNEEEKNAMPQPKQSFEQKLGAAKAAEKEGK